MNKIDPIDTKVQLTDGTIAASKMGKTLIHEHIIVGFTGWQYDVKAPKYIRDEQMSRVVDSLQELKGYGCSTVVDPCPIDVGRDVEFVAEAAQKSGVRIVVATGVYTDDVKLPAIQWQRKEDLVELYVKELTEGVGETGIKCGVIKIATGQGPATEYEKKMIGVAAEVAKITGAPIISHTPGSSHGHEQIDIVEAAGVPANCLVVGHSGDRDDVEYQKSIAKRNAFVGLDRFGMDFILPDEIRMRNLVQLVKDGFRDNILVSQDTILCWLGRKPPEFETAAIPPITHFLQNLAPKLYEMGLAKSDLECILVDNPRALFNNAAHQCSGACAHSQEKAHA
jgi:phosphotriesterase-related protein